MEKEILALFEQFGALVEPDLLATICDQPDPTGRVHGILQSLKEVPFYFDAQLWGSIEQNFLEKVAPEPAPRVSEEAAIQRKEALRRAAARIYDGRAKLDDDEEEVEEYDDESIGHEFEGDAQEDARQFKVVPRSDWRPKGAEYEDGLEIIEDMTGNSTCEGRTQDFITYFRDRYEQIAKMLRQRRELRNAVPVERIRPGQQEIQLIGMVIERATTKNGHRRIELEDTTGMVTCLVRKDETQLCAMADSLVSDEVIGVVGTVSNKGDLLFLDSIIRPDIPRPDNLNKTGAEVPVMAAFLSDIHVGSNTFLAENWKKMLSWLSGNGTSRREQEMAGRLKYLVIPGDLVDGVGIYPGQKDELTIPDIYDQYGAFGDWIANVPDHLQIVVQPGNHDASRPAEPQPAFSQEVKDRFDHHNTTHIANPSYFKMHGVTTLGYHGTSLIDFATSVMHLEYEKPLDSMEFMLQCRHLAPLYGERTPVAPEHHDYLVINRVPDVFVTGHVHVPGVRDYRGVKMINCGTWQSQTLYQKMLNFTPDPARMPIIDLQTLRATMVDFQSPEKVGQTG